MKCDYYSLESILPENINIGQLSNTSDYIQGPRLKKQIKGLPSVSIAVVEEVVKYFT